FQSLIEDFEREQNIPAIEIAAALAKMARGNTPPLLDKNKAREQATWQDDRPVRQDRFERNDRPERGDRFERNERSDRGERQAFPKKERISRPADAGMQTFRIEVGHQHGVKPGNIVGAIANEAGIDSKNIGRIEIYDDY
ncbi:DbpA RNA binding domain-containing protein, partial [Streptococcus danieliae]|nr:DbpA RNA binding domain-containing protein [Streptococcus danieliae]